MSDPNEEKAGPQIVPDTADDAPPTPQPTDDESAERQEIEHRDS